MRMKPRRLAKCSRGAVADAGALALLSESASRGSGGGIGGHGNLPDAGFPSVLNEIAASL